MVRSTWSVALSFSNRREAPIAYAGEIRHFKYTLLKTTQNIWDHAMPFLTPPEGEAKNHEHDGLPGIKRDLALTIRQRCLCRMPPSDFSFAARCGNSSVRVCVCVERAATTPQPIIFEIKRERETCLSTFS